MAALPGVALVGLRPTSMAVPPRVTPRPASSSMKGRAKRPPQSGGAASSWGMTEAKPAARSPPDVRPNISTMAFMKVVPLRRQDHVDRLAVGCAEVIDQRVDALEGTVASRALQTTEVPKAHGDGARLRDERTGECGGLVALGGGDGGAPRADRAGRLHRRSAHRPILRRGAPGGGAVRAA